MRIREPAISRRSQRDLDPGHIGRSAKVRWSGVHTDPARIGVHGACSKRLRRREIAGGGARGRSRPRPIPEASFKRARCRQQNHPRRSHTTPMRHLGMAPLGKRAAVRQTHKRSSRALVRAGGQTSFDSRICPIFGGQVNHPLVAAPRQGRLAKNYGASSISSSGRARVNRQRAAMPTCDVHKAARMRQRTRTEAFGSAGSGERRRLQSSAFSAGASTCRHAIRQGAAARGRGTWRRLSMTRPVTNASAPAESGSGKRSAHSPAQQDVQCSQDVSGPRPPISTSVPSKIATKQTATRPTLASQAGPARRAG